MLTQPENTIKLSDEQQLAIEEVKNRLSNLESEISIANKNLKGIKLETEKAIKDKMYQEELLSNVVDKISNSTKELSELEPKVTEKTEQLNNLLSTIQKESNSHEIKKTELLSKEKAIKDEEVKLSENQEAFRKEKSEFEVEKNKLSTFKEALLEVIKTW